MTPGQKAVEGILVHSPAPLYSHPWYGHCTLAPHHLRPERPPDFCAARLGARRNKAALVSLANETQITGIRPQSAISTSTLTPPRAEDERTH